MNKKHLFGILAIVFLFVFSILRQELSPAHTHHHGHIRRIGGCRGTRYGCCPDSRTACNKDCSNC